MISIWFGIGVEPEFGGDLARSRRRSARAARSPSRRRARWASLHRAWCLTALPSEQLAEHRVDLVALRRALHREVVGRLAPRARTRPTATTGARSTCGRRELEVGVIARGRQQLLAQEAGAARRIGAERVAVRRLRDVDVPAARVALGADLLGEVERREHDRAAGARVVEERVLVDFLGVVGVADEHEVDFAVLARQEQVQQREEALGEVLLVLVHRRRHVHQAEHHGARDRLRPPDAIAVAQVRLVDERQLAAPARRGAQLLVDPRRVLRVADRRRRRRIRLPAPRARARGCRRARSAAPAIAAACARSRGWPARRSS